MNIFYEDEDGWLGWSEKDNIISIHTEIVNWNILKYKKYLFIFSSMLNKFKGRELYSIAKTEKAKKFNELFGLSLLEEKDGVFIMGIKA